MTSLEWVENPPARDLTAIQRHGIGCVCQDCRPDLFVLVGPGEIAEKLGKQRATVAAWRSRGLLPEPLCYLDDGTKGRSVRGRTPSRGLPVWQWSAIREWARATGRL